MVGRRAGRGTVVPGMAVGGGGLTVVRDGAAHEGAVSYTHLTLPTSDLV